MSHEQVSGNQGATVGGSGHATVTGTDATGLQSVNSSAVAVPADCQKASNCQLQVPEKTGARVEAPGTAPGPSPHVTTDYSRAPDVPTERRSVEIAKGLPRELRWRYPNSDSVRNDGIPEEEEQPNDRQPFSPMGVRPDYGIVCPGCGEGGYLLDKEWGLCPKCRPAGEAVRVNYCEVPGCGAVLGEDSAFTKCFPHREADRLAFESARTDCLQPDIKHNLKQTFGKNGRRELAALDDEEWARALVEECFDFAWARLYEDKTLDQATVARCHQLHQLLVAQFRSMGVF